MLTMKTFLILALTLVIATGIAQHDTKTQQNEIQGTWQNSAFGTLILNADGSGELDGEAIKYTTKENKFAITIVEEGQTHVYNFTLRGNSLTLSGGDFEEPVTFTRSASTKNNRDN